MLCQSETMGVSLCSSLRCLSLYPTLLLVSLSITDFAPEECHLHGIGICCRAHRELLKYVFILLQDPSVEEIEHFQNVSFPSPNPDSELWIDFQKNLPEWIFQHHQIKRILTYRGCQAEKCPNLANFIFFSQIDTIGH